MYLNIIHLENRLDRLQSFMEEMNTQSIKYKVWDGVLHTNTATGISKAHKAIVRDAQQKKLPHVIIAEDDIKFSHPNSWKYYLSQMPKDFDLYVGLMYDGITDGKGRIITTKGMSGTNTLYTISEKFYDFFLAIDDSKHLDRELGKFATLNKYILCEPMVCSQLNGYSSNFKRMMNYDAYLEGKQLYGQ